MLTFLSLARFRYVKTPVVFTYVRFRAFPSLGVCSRSGESRTSHPDLSRRQRAEAGSVLARFVRLSVGTV